MGLVSFGMTECGKYPGVYVNLEPFLPWIDKEAILLEKTSHLLAKLWPKLELLFALTHGLLMFGMAIMILTLAAFTFEKVSIKKIR